MKKTKPKKRYVYYVPEVNELFTLEKTVAPKDRNKILRLDGLLFKTYVFKLDYDVYYIGVL